MEKYHTIALNAIGAVSNDSNLTPQPPSLEGLRADRGTKSQIEL
jgi:hypothetical protein